MKRTILSVAYPLAEVSPDSVGGCEQILTILDQNLSSAGHTSLVIAAKGSKIEGTLIPSPAARGRLTDAMREAGRAAHRRLIAEALAHYPVDLVHLHGLDFHTCVPKTNVPVLATLHLPVEWYPSAIFRGSAPFYINCVSGSQHRTCPGSPPHLLEPVHNGVNVDRLVGNFPRRDYALALGRICAEKGYHFALDAARAAHTELLLAGEVFPYAAHVEYFRKEIAPRLDRRRRFIGPLRFARKRRLLSEAKCVLIPSTVAETSSLVAMEALACGTPVIAFESGALPEIVDHGRTGFIVKNQQEMADAIRNIDSIRSEACRRAARSRFSAQRMSARYMNLYDRLIPAHSGRGAFQASMV